METELKQCTKCKEWFPPTAEYFFRDKQKASGLRPDCKACNQAGCTTYRHSHPEQSRDYARRKYYQNQDYYRVYRLKHRDEFLAYFREYAATNSKSAVNRSRQWKQNNPVRFRLAQRLARLRRDKRMKEAGGRFSIDDIKQMDYEQSNLCAYCGIRLFDDYEIDHIRPVVKGGSNNVDNLALSCPSCNAHKQGRTPQEWGRVRGW